MAADELAMARGGAVVTDVSDESSGDGAVPGDSDTVLLVHVTNRPLVCLHHKAIINK